MIEHLVSFETAKLAKEKGFNLNFPTAVYTEEGDLWISQNLLNERITGKPFPKILFTAPTQSLLQKWLREVHHIFLHVVTDNEKYDFHGWDMIHPISINEDIREIGGEPCRYNSWEEALEIGLQEGLKLIE